MGVLAFAEQVRPVVRRSSPPPSRLLHGLFPSRYSIRSSSSSFSSFLRTNSHDYLSYLFDLKNIINFKNKKKYYKCNFCIVSTTGHFAV